MTTATISSAPPRRRLGIRTRRAVLIAHISSAGAWFGIDVVMAVFVFTALFTGDAAIKALCFQALEVFAVWPLLVTGLICLATGVILGLGSKWGVVRYWWVATKLVLNLILTGLVLVALRPQVAQSAEQARQWLAGEPVTLGIGDLIYPPIVSPAALLIAMTLSVVKPWGLARLRR
ncbi:MAG TPA: hypothetical protein VGJ13_03105 [Pseudonocardiaceae bacterium]|jgi:uncharacterized membrane protein